MAYRYVSTIDTARTDFTIATINSNPYLQFGVLSEADTDYIESLLTETVVGFFQEGSHVSSARIEATFDETNGLQLEAVPSPALTLDEEYEIRFTQARPGTDAAPSGEARTDAEIAEALEGKVRDEHIAGDLSDTEKSNAATKFGTLVVSGTPEVGQVPKVQSDGITAWDDDENTQTSVTVDDETIENDADDGLRLKAEGVDDGHIADDLSDAQQSAFRGKLDIDGAIEGANVWLEHFRLPYSSNFFSTQASRWGSGTNTDPDIDYTIYMQPTVAHREIVEELLAGAEIQVREPDGSVRNTFTLVADAIGPDSNGVYTLNGSFENTPATFVNGTNYGLYFSQSRPHSVRTGDTISGDGNETPLDVAENSLTGRHLSDSLDAAQQAEAQERLGIEDTVVWGGQISISHVPVDNINTGSNARWGLQSSGLNHFLRFEDLSGRDQAYVESLLIGAKIGFYNGDTEAERATVASVWNSTNSRIRITFDTAGALASSIDYDLRITQYRPEHGIPPGGDDDQVLKKQSGDDYDADWENESDGGASSFSGLSDTPETIVRDRYVKTAASTDELEYVENAPAAAQRSESVTFQAGGETIEHDGVIISPAVSDAVAVTFPRTDGGNPQILGPGSNADGFVVLQRGIYLVTIRGLAVAATARCTAQFRIYEYDADILTALPAGETQNAYIRYQHTNAQRLFQIGDLEIAEDNTPVKLVAISALPDAGQPGANDSQWTLNAGMILKLHRVGIKGEPGAGVLDEISEANILDDASLTVGGITGRRAKALIDHYVSDVDTFHLTVDRNYVTGTPNAANDITIVLHSGTTYNIGVSHYTGAEALPDNYLRALPVGTEIRLVDGDIVWVGRLISVHDVTGTSATLRVNFTDRTGLLSDFTVNDNVEISFGYSPAQIPKASEIDVEGDLDGNLSESDPDLESIIQSVDNFELGGDGDFVAAGTGIGVSGVGTEADPKVINNTEPFTDAESDILSELANSARHTLDDDLILRLQYGAEHFFDGRNPVITGAAIIEGRIYVGSDDGFVNDERGVNEEGIYDLTTNNNDPATAGNWYFADGSHIRIRERSAAGVWSNASPSQDSTGIPVTAGIGLSVDPENRTVMYFSHMRSDGVRVEGLEVSTFPSSGAITYQSEHDITRASINTVLTANDLGTLSEIRNTLGSVGVTAMGALNDIVYFVVSGVINNENGIPVSAILRVTTSGTGTARTFSLDANYCKIVGIRNGVQGIVPTEEGFWLSTEHTVYEYHHSIGVGGGGFSSVALGSADLEPSALNSYIATGIQIPTAEEADYLLINFGREIVAGNPGRKRGGEELVQVSSLRALHVATVGGLPTFQDSLNFEDDLSASVLKLGRTASYELLYASSGLIEPAIDFEVRRVLKAETVNTVEVNEDFFEGDGSEAEPIDLKSNIGLTDRATFRTRIDAQQNIPMAVYFLHGQTERNPTTLRTFPKGVDSQANNACLSFTNVQQTIYGGNTAIAPHILWANINVISDADWNGTGESRSALSLTAGTYTFSMHVEGGAAGDASQSLRMLIATSGDDDIAIANRPGASMREGGTLFSASFDLNVEILPVVNTQNFYFVVDEIATGTNNSQFRGYLIIKRHS